MGINKGLEEAFREDILLTLKQTQNLCLGLKEELINSVDLFRDENLKEAGNLFDQHLSAMQTLLISMETMQEIMVQDDELKLVWKENLVHWQMSESQFRKVLLNLLISYKNEDYFALADQIEGELIDSIRSWEQFIEYIISSMDELE